MRATGATGEMFREIKAGIFLAIGETDDVARRWIERREQRLFFVHRATRSCTRPTRCVGGYVLYGYTVMHDLIQSWIKAQRGGWIADARAALETRSIKGCEGREGWMDERLTRRFVFVVYARVVVGCRETSKGKYRGVARQVEPRATRRRGSCSRRVVEWTLWSDQL